MRKRVKEITETVQKLKKKSLFYSKIMKVLSPFIYKSIEIIRHNRCIIIFLYVPLLIVSAIYDVILKNQKDIIKSLDEYIEEIDNIDTKLDELLK